MNKIILALTCWALSSYVLATPQQVSSLDQVPKLIKNKEGTAKYLEQINGDEKPDGFGTALPSGLSAKDIVSLLAPKENLELATLVGAKAWPYRADSFVVIACFSGNKKHYDYKKKNNQQPTCNKDYDANHERYIDQAVYLGILEYKENVIKPTLVASYSKPLDIKTGWQYKKLDESTYYVPSSYISISRGKNNTMPEEYERFDFAPFKINETETAFGLRLGWNEGYMGGFGYFEALALFKIQGDRLINILSEPIYYFQNIAGEWHKDQTRDHIFYEGQNRLSMLPNKTEGYYNLQIKTQNSHCKRLFKWNSKLAKYMPVKAKKGHRV